MAIIQSYPINDNVKDTDLLLGVTNTAPSGNPIYQTKSFRVSDVRGSSGLITLTTNGTSGPATLVGNILNIPQYSGVPTSRTITINGVTQDLSANRTWTVSGTGIAWLESNVTDLTVWNNGKGNIETNTSFGEGVLKSNTTGRLNTGFGWKALFNNTVGEFNTAIGFLDLANNTTGIRNVGVGGTMNQNTTGSDNTAVGLASMNQNVTGSFNTSIGRAALFSIFSGNNNTAIGYEAGRFAGATSSFNVYIGSNSGPELVTNENNKLYISNSIGTPLIGGNFAEKTVSIDGSISAVKFILPSNAPTSSTDTGTLGEIRYDANFMYVCVATNTWKRSALAAW
jgi:hypothetical protein